MATAVFAETLDNIQHFTCTSVKAEVVHDRRRQYDWFPCQVLAAYFLKTCTSKLTCPILYHSVEILMDLLLQKRILLRSGHHLDPVSSLLVMVIQ
jgi:hypothetical protein